VLCRWMVPCGLGIGCPAPGATAGVRVVGRLRGRLAGGGQQYRIHRADRVLRLPAPPRPVETVSGPLRHGGEFHLADTTTWPDPGVITTTETTCYGTAVAFSWDRLHPRLTHRAAWLDHPGELPILEGTLICLTVDHLAGDRGPKPMWLWSSRAGATPSHVDRLWQAYLRRFDLEHTFRLFKQTLGWTRPRLRDPAAADRWTWLIIAAHIQLRLARHLTADLRRPSERPVPPGRLTPPASVEGLGTSERRSRIRHRHRNTPPRPRTPTRLHQRPRYPP
jgi:hypothetical protein